MRRVTLNPHLPPLILAGVWVCAAAVSGNGQEVTTLGRGVTIERTLSVGDEHRYQLTLARGDYASVIVEQRGIDVQIRFFEPDGTMIRVDDEYRSRGEERLEVVAEADGSYPVTVKPSWRNAAMGQYAIRVVEVRPAFANDHLLHEARKLDAQYGTARDAGRYEEMRRFAERALAIAEQVLGPSHPFVAMQLDHLGYYYNQKQELATSLALYQRALETSERALGAEHPQTITVARSLAYAYLEVNEMAKAERLAQRALDDSEKVLGPDHYLVARCLLNAAQVGWNSRTSEPLLLRALTIAEKTVGPDHELTANVLNQLGILYTENRNYQKADDYLLRSLAAYRKTQGSENLNHVVVLHNLGRIARERKDYTKAEEYYRQAIAVVEHAFGPENPRLAVILNNIANVYRAKGEYAKSLEAHLRVLRISETTAGPDQPLTMLSLGNIARTYAAQGDLPHAVQFQSRADAVIERNIDINVAIGSEREKLAYLRSVGERTDRTLSLNVNLAPNDPDAAALAALVVLQRKGRVLDAMSESFASLRQRTTGAARTLIDQYSDTTAQLARLVLSGPRSMSFADHQRAVTDLGERKERLEADISRLASEFRAQSQPVTLAAVQGMIPARAALVEFAVYRPFDPKAESNADAYGPPRYSVYVMRATGGVRWRDLGPAASMDEAIGSLRAALRDPRGPGVRVPSRTVDEAIMRPVRELAGDATHLLVSPDGALNLVPFGALIDERGRYLVERYSFTYLTTGRDLLRMQVSRASRSTPLIVANPAFGQAATAQQAPAAGGSQNAGRRRSVTVAGTRSEMYFAPLGGTALEAHTIRMLYPDARSLSGVHATESAIKGVAAPRILHIATHGFFLQATPAGDGRRAGPASSAEISSDNPLLRSGLALARANLHGEGDDDGILTALEATGLNLWGTKLVVLSACDTGLGEVRNGEGVYGLRRAFVLAGAESLVMSLWPVSDYSTRRVMTAFYTNLRRGVPRGAALRQVQLQMLKADPHLHPFYWANFIQSGDWTRF